MTRDRSELFRGVTEAEQERLTSLAQTIEVPSGSTLFDLGTAATCLYLVERGRIALTLPMQVDGRENDVVVEEGLPGQALGWSALIPPHRFTLRAAALLDSDVLAIPRLSLLEYFAAHPDVGYLVTRNIAEIVGRRLQVFQTMWMREMQRVVQRRAGASGSTGAVA